MRVHNYTVLDHTQYITNVHLKLISRRYGETHGETHGTGLGTVKKTQGVNPECNAQLLVCIVKFILAHISPCFS
jgi:hypothetical protein